jgi:hypothetical protein
MQPAEQDRKKLLLTGQERANRGLISGKIGLYYGGNRPKLLPSTNTGNSSRQRIPSEF